MSNIDTASAYRLIRNGRVRLNPEAKPKRVKRSNDLRRVIADQHLFLANERAPAADELELLNVLNAMARRPRHPDTIDAAITAVWSQLPKKNKPSIYDADLRHFVIHYPWQKHNEFIPAVSGLVVAVHKWIALQQATRKGE